MHPSTLASLVNGLKGVLDEHGFERALSDASWLHNILADYSPQTLVLNRVVATVAREGFPDLLRRATTTVESDAVVGQAISRLVSAHAIEEGSAYDAVTVWAAVLDIAYTRKRPAGVVLGSSVVAVGDRLARKIQRLLDEAEVAEENGDWVLAVERYDDVLTINPLHTEALQLRGLAERRKTKNPSDIPSNQAPVKATQPSSTALPAKPAVVESNKVDNPTGWLSNAGIAYAKRLRGERGGQSQAVAVPKSPETSTVPTKPAAVVKSSGPKVQMALKADYGEDSFGRRASVVIAGVKVTFRYCAPGRFLMGSPESEVGRFDDEGPAHEVELTQGFWMAEVPVTQQLWEAVASSNPSRFKGEDQPVEKVSWFDCDGWMRKANSMAGGLNLRFPTEAEWEYAARAGTTGPRYGGLDFIAWHDANSGKQTHPVRHKIANAWGLYDMLGNVWEWCSDGYSEYRSGRVTDPTGPSWCSNRVSRGGGWNEYAGDVRSAYRRGVDPSLRYPNLGLRFVLNAQI
jgi:sulfatase modifying factor 1